MCRIRELGPADFHITCRLNHSYHLIKPYRLHDQHSRHTYNFKPIPNYRRNLHPPNTLLFKLEHSSMPALRPIQTTTISPRHAKRYLPARMRFIEMDPAFDVERLWRELPCRSVELLDHEAGRGHCRVYRSPGCLSTSIYPCLLVSASIKVRIDYC